MKECLKCHKVYDDSMNFCTSCGSALENMPETGNSTDSTSSTGSTPPPIVPPRKKSSILKKVIISVAIVLLAVFVIGSHINNAATYLRIEPNQIVAPKSGGEITIDIDYDGYLWSINHQPDWVEIEKDKNSFTIKVKPNRSQNNRQGTITVQSGKLLTQVKVGQSGFATFIRASKNQMSFPKKGGIENVEVQTDGINWKIQSDDFIKTAKVNDSTLKISVPQNTSTQRNGKVVIGEDGRQWAIYVHQGGKCHYCNGTGKSTCTACYGTGSLLYSTCYYCGGTGLQDCRTCGGSGEIE